MARTKTTKQANFERKPAEDMLPIPAEGVAELAESVAFLNDDDNREIVSAWNRHSRDLKKALKEHIDLEDVGSGISIQFGQSGEVVMAPQKFAARNIKTEEKTITRITVVGS